MLGAAVCCTFLRSIRMPSLRVAAILLSLMFLYDVFMVGSGCRTYFILLYVILSWCGPGCRTYFMLYVILSWCGPWLPP